MISYLSLSIRCHLVAASEHTIFLFLLGYFERTSFVLNDVIRCSSKVNMRFHPVISRISYLGRFRGNFLSYIWIRHTKFRTITNVPLCSTVWLHQTILKKLLIDISDHLLLVEFLCLFTLHLIKIFIKLNK